MEQGRVSCCLIGGDSLLTACGDMLLADGHEIVAVISHVSEVVQWARGKQLALIDPTSDYLTRLRAKPFDYLFSIANLDVVSADVLACARKDAINFHEGPLPAYAGVNTPVWALVNGETSWGITWHRMTTDVDAGDIFLGKTFPIADGETTLSLNRKCFAAALETFPELLDALVAGDARTRPQGRTERYFGKHQRLTAEAVLDWGAPAASIDALVRALDFGRHANPMAVPLLLRGDAALIVSRARTLDGLSADGLPGTVAAVSADGIDVATGGRGVRLLAFTTQAGEEVTPADAARRLGLAPGVRLDSLAAPERARLKALTPALSKTEPFWVRRLAALDPVTLPFAPAGTDPRAGETGALQALPLAVPAAFRERFATDVPAALFTAFAICLARLGRRARFDLALTDATTRGASAGLETLVAAQRPLAVSIDEAAGFDAALAQLAIELAAVRGRPPYLLDVVARHPELRRREALRASPVLPVGVSLDSDLGPGQSGRTSLLTLAIDAGGQTAKLVPDRAALGSAVVQAVAAQLRAVLAAVAADPARPIRDLDLPAGVEPASAFWKEMLNGLPAPAPPAAGPSAGQDRASRGFRLSRASSDGLRRLSAEHDLGLDDCVTAAWAALLAIRRSEPDVVFGSAPGTGAALPIRVLVEESQPITALLKAVRARRAAIRRFEETSLTDILAWNDLPPGTELYDTVVAGAGQVEPPSAPLVLFCHDGPELTFTIDHDKRRFDPPVVDRLGEHLLAILNAIAANPAGPVAELPRVSDGEKHKLLIEWNDSATDFPRVSVHGAIQQQVERTPDAIAVVFRRESLTYRELNRRANRVAHDLRKRGVGPDVMVGIFVERSLEMLVGLLGILKAGGAYVPMDPLYPPERLAMMLEDSRAPVILTLARLQKFLPPHQAQVITLDAGAPNSPADPGAGENPTENTSPQNLAYVIFTSGSTGRPKGVQIEHRNVINFFTGIDRSLGHQSPGVWLAVTSISFDISVLELFWTLSRGFKIVLQEEADRAPVTSSPGAALQAKGMEFSLFYFAADAGDVAGNKYRLLLEGAKYADRNGFAAIWTPERHFHAFGGLYPNPALTSAAIAVLTERIQIRAGSVVLPLHNPIRAAEEWAVVDNLSGGRVGLSFASGWHAADFALAPANYADRKKLMAQGIETVRALWRGEAVPAKSGDGRDITVKIFPAPIQREPRMWVTASSSPDTFAMAGKSGANVLTNLLSMKMEELLANIAVYRAAWKEAGHRGQGHVTLMLHTFVGRDLDEVKRKVRGPFLDYLRSSTDLISKARWEQSMFARPDKQRAGAPAAAAGPATNSGKGLEDLTPEEMDAMMAHAFERYFKTTGLFGTPESCLEMTEKLRDAGVDEIACLIDFGVDAASVLESLEPLNELRKRCLPHESAGSEDYSVPAQIRRHGVTHLQCTPSLARILASDADALESLRPLKKVMLGGEALPAALAATLAEVVSGEILNMYGPTETTVWSTTSRVPKGAGRITIGRPIANTQIYVVDAARRPCPIGVAGEILIGGDGVVRGYLDRPELTAEKFVPNPFVSDPSARLYRTGDLGRWLPDGTLDFVGRIDHQVKIRGYRIELGEIESVIGKHPGVAACAVVVREDAPGDQRIVGYLVPRQGDRAETGDTTSDWRTIWDETYRQEAADPTFNTAGWNSSFDGTPIPELEMREWVLRTTERILALRPRRVLEIGCGTGLYLFRVAPHCEHYCGVDVSPAALDRIAGQLGALNLPQVSLRQKPADDVSGLEPGSFDTVVVNSVIQYFPNVDYLLKVIEQAFGLLAPGGSLFIGDVRSLPLLDLFHAAIELHQAADDMPADELARRIETRKLQERELVVDPAFFRALEGLLPGVGEVRIDLKRGSSSNELTRFRYDVVLRKMAPGAVVEGPGASLDAAASPTFSPAAVATRLAGAPASLVVTNVLNRHVARERRAVQLLRGGGLGQVADLRAALRAAGEAWGSIPEDFYGLAADHDVEVRPASSGASDCFDVVFHKRGGAAVAATSPPVTARRPWASYANRPSQRAANGNLLPELRAYLKSTLPPFMVPTAFVVLDALPLTPNGKLDRKALPAPDRTRQESAADYQAPTQGLEQIVASVWQDLLGLDQVSTVDNLFDLGANSLLVVRANGKLRAALQRDVSLVDMFQYPTVKSLAAFLAQGDKSADGAPAADPTLEQSHERGQSRRDALLRRRNQRPGDRET